MAKALQKVIIDVRTEEELYQKLVVLSQEYGKAWVFSVSPSHVVTYEQYQNPSSVPDYFYDLTRGIDYRHGAIGYKGQIRGFTETTRVREKNRGLGRG